MADQQNPEVYQLLIPGVVWPRVNAWLASRNLGTACVGQISEDDLPTWVIIPRDLPAEALREAAWQALADALNTLEALGVDPYTGGEHGPQGVWGSVGGVSYDYRHPGVWEVDGRG